MQKNICQNKEKELKITQQYNFKTSLKKNEIIIAKKKVGRPSKQQNLTNAQKKFIQAWINKNIKLSDCIKFTGLSESTLYNIRKNFI